MTLCDRCGEEQDEPRRQRDEGVSEEMTFTATLGIGGKGTPISEFCSLVDIVTKRHGKDVMISECDKKGHMHFSKDKKHLGYIDINNGSLIWDTAKP